MLQSFKPFSSICISCTLLQIVIPPTARNASEPCIPHDGQYSEELIKSLGWLPLVSLIIYVVAFAIGKNILFWFVGTRTIFWYVQKTKKVDDKIFSLDAQTLEI